MNFKISVKQFVGLILGVLVAVPSYFFLGIGNLFFFILVLSIILAVAPFVISIVLNQGRQKEKEDKFLEFTRDLVESVKSGTPINKSILNLENRDYGALSPHIKKLSNQVNIGIGLDVALRNFAKDTRSKVISRAVTLIYEAQRAGGEISTIIQSVSNSVDQTESLKKERLASISNLAVQGYIIFLVFIAIMLILEFSILPMVSEFAGSNIGGLEESSAPQIESKDFSQPLFIMLIVQSIFAGLVIGKIAEGSIISGIRHSFILLGLTLVITTGARAFLG